MLRRFAATLVDLSALAGIVVLVTGGLRVRHSQFLPDLSLMSYGEWFLPLALCLVFDIELPGSRVMPWVTGWAAKFDAWAPRRQRLWLTASIAVALLVHSLVVYLRYYSFQSAMDLAIYANACRGALYSTMKGDVWLFADHFEPMLLLFTPLCRAFSPALSLLAVQTLGWGVGAFGIYMLATRQRYRPAISWLLAMLYLSFAGHVTIAYYDFHLLALTLAIVPWLWWAIVAERYTWLIVLGLAYLGLKESAPLSLAGLGAFLVLSRGSRERRRVGLGFVIVGLGTFILILKVVYPAFRGGEGTMYFAKYYGHFGKDLGEFIHTVLTRPVYVAYTVLKRSKLLYMSALLAPFLFFPVYRPLYALPVLPAVLINVLSNDRSLFSGGFHYDSEIYPALFAMAVVAFVGLGARAQALWVATLLVFFSAPSALGIARWNVPTAAQRRLSAELAAHVPYDRAIAAPQRIAAHLTDREKLYMFDYWLMEEDWKRADLVVVGYHGPSLGWYTWATLDQEKLPKMLPQLKQVYQDPADPRFRVFEVLPQPASGGSSATAPSANRTDALLGKEGG